jgi:hypothetical protein
MAGFTMGLREDLAASVGPERRTPYNDVVVDGVLVTAGYGQDLVLLETGFSVGRSGFDDLANAGEPVLSFGGWQSSSGMRDSRAFRAADQLWTALAGASETKDGAAITRTTAGRRAACRRYDPSDLVSIDCALSGLIRADAAEASCP